MLFLQPSPLLPFSPPLTYLSSYSSYSLISEKQFRQYGNVLNLLLFNL